MSEENKNVKEAPFVMLLPMITIAAFCVLFGVYNPLPLRHLIQPILGARMEGQDFSGFPHSAFLVIMTLVSLGAAILNHMYGVKRTGKGASASDHIHYAPGLHQIYDLAERRFFDPYNIGMNIVNVYANIAFGIDRGFDWLYDVFIVKLTYAFTDGIREAHNGSYSTYIVWSITGIVAFVVVALKGIH